MSRNKEENQMNAPDLSYWFALRMVDGIGAVSYRALLDSFGSPRQVFAAPLETIMAISGISKKIAYQIKHFEGWERAEKEAKRLADSDVKLVTILDADYPPRLLDIYDAPPFLFVKGELLPDEICLAVVGSRLASEYGKHITHKLAFALAQCGITIVSGLARGVDAAAHRGALAGKGRTIAVLGCGIDVVYPLENRALFEKIPVNGALVSEYFFGVSPSKENFPLRNRIISGISLGVLVTEATDKSGSLITTNFAAEQGREVFATPGPIDSQTSRGTHLLLKNGAKLVESVEDIMEEIAPQIGNSNNRPAACHFAYRKSFSASLPMAESPRVVIPEKAPLFAASAETEELDVRILAMLAKGKMSLEEIAQASNAPIKDALGVLSLLEIRGLVKQLPGKIFIIEE